MDQLHNIVRRNLASFEMIHLVHLKVERLLGGEGGILRIPLPRKENWTRILPTQRTENEKGWRWEAHMVSEITQFDKIVMHNSGSRIYHGRP